MKQLQTRTSTGLHIVAIKDAAGNNINTYDYDIWGNVLIKTERMNNPYRYTGEPQDDESGLIYLWARYYDPTIRRFISKDSYEGQIDKPLTLNLYTYTANNPLKYKDPTGHFFDKIADIGFAIYDTYQLITNPSWENAIYLALDVGAACVPICNWCWGSSKNCYTCG